MTDIRERLAEALWEKFGWLEHPDCERLANAILAEFDVTEREWEYGVKWGDEPDDGYVSNCGSRERAESRAAASHGDKVVRRTPARTIPAGPWEEVPDE
jgi:hypothetical protein